ncbi:hypothetical protein BaRGS_00026442 [Batillaria attramentaria]|uniref:Uncharacterized protein n=1 Tax=Batillaria attramentaria TaxID=370345 RepID=A0ABD0K508_9CAEN
MPPGSLANRGQLSSSWAGRPPPLPPENPNCSSLAAQLVTMRYKQRALLHVIFASIASCCGVITMVTILSQNTMSTSTFPALHLLPYFRTRPPEHSRPHLPYTENGVGSKVIAQPPTGGALGLIFFRPLPLCAASVMRWSNSALLFVEDCSVTRLVRSAI